MVIGFEDEKGKIFTEVVTKMPIPIMMQTTTHRVLGNIHVRPDQRLKDELDRAESFLAVTEASILDADGKTVHRTEIRERTMARRGADGLRPNTGEVIQKIG